MYIGTLALPMGAEHDEVAHHNSWLELKPHFLAVQSFIASANRVHVHIKTGNATVVAYLQHFSGSKSVSLNFLTREIWL